MNARIVNTGAAVVEVRRGIRADAQEHVAEVLERVHAVGPALVLGGFRAGTKRTPRFITRRS